jgi:hypothetical protein
MYRKPGGTQIKWDSWNETHQLQVSAANVNLLRDSVDTRKKNTATVIGGIGCPIISDRCPSLSAHESDSMLRTYLDSREKQERVRERERETSKRHVGKAHSVLIIAILLAQRLSCYWDKIVSLPMLTNLRLADLRLTTAQQRSTGQNLPSCLY